MIKLEIDEESFLNNLLAVYFLGELIHTINKENTIVLNDIKLKHWLSEIKEKIEEERNARN